MPRTRRPALTGLVLLCGAAAIGAAVLSARQAAPADRLKALAHESLAAIDGNVRIGGLRAPVQVIRDTWGVPHIYAQNTDDLFMAQGYVMAQDRLWQMEVWRRHREGRLAEILGPQPQVLARDRIARLLKYRGPMDGREWTSYHPEGKRIFTAFAAGVNAFIADHANNLPIEFTVTGIKPDPWTAETVVLHSAGFGNAASELRLATNIARLGVDAANREAAPDPWDDLRVPDGLDVSSIDAAVQAAAREANAGAIRPVLIDVYKGLLATPAAPPEAPATEYTGDINSPGSNNWVVSGKLSATGKPVVVNDPHREVTNPSLRYIVHLNAPGWNVIGAGEPPFVGVAIAITTASPGASPSSAPIRRTCTSRT